MKTYLLLSQRTMKAAVLASLLFLTGTMSFAQIVKTYASSQTNQVLGVCLGCGVLNPQNAVGSNETDYSTIQVSVGLLARTEQTLIFPTSNIANNTNKLVIGIGSNGTPLSAQVLGGVSIETFNGDVSNNDYQSLGSTLIKLGDSDPSKAEIELTMNIPFDRVKINVNSGLLNIGGELRVYYSYQYKDPFINFKAHSQNGLFTLDKNISAEGSEVSLTNTSGKEVFRSKLTSNTFETKQPQGVYIMNFTTKEGKSYSKKVIIK
ncbi:T9SS type A sorting domain-containing protein [Chryseobacterium viscerum]|uniref:T9SS C-terminal target domain-containing protein n=1 Tax=Chryseobacterium viscerum TaxID=1037377 RepID=A0A316WVN5_9FLAO|nr:T9SS type A sorting domain-containing protein [Chryseobacterium viscerum]KAB1229194.1 T9SS type A sorting domain-containing protein [Chryseobacterium viscerum]PWN65307.1 T9SS C-terminal target domain-containing protein [Chryseobacterium viscerum]